MSDKKRVLLHGYFWYEIKTNKNRFILFFQNEEIFVQLHELDDLDRITDSRIG